MSDFEKLVADLRSNDKENVIAGARALGALGDDRAVEPLIGLLLRTTDPGVRDALAVALRDIGDERALSPLLALIADPATQGHRGTLVYALGGFDLSGNVPELVHLIITGNFEVSRQAFTVLESIAGEIDDEDWRASLAAVRAAIPTADPEKHGLLGELIVLFEG